MNRSVGSHLYWSILALLGSACLAAAGGVVSDSSEAALRAALAGGGTVTVAFDGTITLSNSVTISDDTIIDATGHALAISGGGSVRLFNIQPGVTLTLQNLTLTNGLALGTNGNAGLDGGPGNGGAVYNDQGTLNAMNCRFLSNTAQGGNGGDSTFPNLIGNGGAGSGGAVYLNYGYLNATNCVFALNRGLGGTGGVGGLAGGPAASTGGDARGGAICGDGGSLQLVNCMVWSNQAAAGPGRRFAAIGASTGGTAYGGAICTATSEVWVVRCTVSTNSDISSQVSSAYGGAIHANAGNVHLVESVLGLNTVTGGRGIGSGTGAPIAAGHAFGGAVNAGAGSVWITNSTLYGNLALGGAGYFYGVAGSGFGGAVFSYGSLEVVNSTACQNGTLGGAPEVSYGTPGSSFGGGLCNKGGTMLLNYVTVAQNRADVAAGTQPGTAASLGGGVYSTNGAATLHCTIVANSLSGSNVFGSIVDNGYNLSSDASGHFTGPGSLNNTDPKLGPLGDNGGPTPTMPLLAGSPAIAAADPAACLPTDQRGYPRPCGAASDIGAFESLLPFVICGHVYGATLKDEISISAGTNGTLTVAGNYSLGGLAAGDYTVTPLHPDYLFIPSNRVVTVGPNQVGVDFKAYRWNALSLEGLSDGTLHQVFAGTNGQTYRLLVSPNLVDWTPIATNTMGPNNYLDMFDPVQPGPAQRFYRMVSP